MNQPLIRPRLSALAFFSAALIFGCGGGSGTGESEGKGFAQLHYPPVGHFVTSTEELSGSNDVVLRAVVRSEDGALLVREHRGAVLERGDASVEGNGFATEYIPDATDSQLIQTFSPPASARDYEHTYDDGDVAINASISSIRSTAYPTIPPATLHTLRDAVSDDTLEFRAVYQPSSRASSSRVVRDRAGFLPSVATTTRSRQPYDYMLEQLERDGSGDPTKWILRVVGINIVDGESRLTLLALYSNWQINGEPAPDPQAALLAPLVGVEGGLGSVPITRTSVVIPERSRAFPFLYEFRDYIAGGDSDVDARRREFVADFSAGLRVAVVSAGLGTLYAGPFAGVVFGISSGLVTIVHRQALRINAEQEIAIGIEDEPVRYRCGMCAL